MGKRILRGYRIAAIAAVAVAAALAEDGREDGLDESGARAVTVTLTPGASGAQVCAKGDRDDHVDFRVEFRNDLVLSVNGVTGVHFDPWATYSVLIECSSVDGSWLATTRVANLSAGGVIVFELALHPIGGAAEYAYVIGAAAHQACAW